MDHTIALSELRHHRDQHKNERVRMVQNRDHIQEQLRGYEKDIANVDHQVAALEVTIKMLEAQQ